MEEWRDFRHYSPQAISVIYPVDHDQHHKPSGLYFARGQAWWDWTIRAHFSPHDYTHLYALDVANTPPLNIVRITATSVQELEHRYKQPPDFQENLFYTFNWKALTSDYDGAYVAAELAQSHLPLWSAFDVETLVLWSTSVRLTFLNLVSRASDGPSRASDGLSRASDGPSPEPTMFTTEPKRATRWTVA